MLGSAWQMIFQDINQMFKDAHDEREFKQRIQYEFEQGIFSAKYRESQSDYDARMKDFLNGIIIYNYDNEKIRHLFSKLAFYAINYHPELKKEINEITKVNGFLPIEIIEVLPTLIRKHFIKKLLVNPITIENVGSVDRGVGKNGFVIDLACFSEVNKGTFWDFSGTNELNTHFFKEDSRVLIKYLEHSINVMKSYQKKEQSAATVNLPEGAGFEVVDSEKGDMDDLFDLNAIFPYVTGLSRLIDK